MAKRRKSILLRLAVCVFIAYLGVTLVSQQIRISSEQSKILSIKNQITGQNAQNEQIKRLISTANDDKFTEDVARDKLDYALPGERIFVNTPGN